MGLNSHLEKRWKEYKIQTFISRVVFSVFAFFAVLSAAYFVYLKSLAHVKVEVFEVSQTPKISQNHETQENSDEQTSKEVVIEAIKEKEQYAVQIVQKDLKPEIKELKEASESLQKEEKEETKRANVVLKEDMSFEEKIRNLEVIVKKTPPAIQAAPKEVQVKVKPESEEVQVSFNITTQETGVSGLIEAFNKEPSFEKAISIARYFQKQKNSSKAIEWSIKASNIDENQDEPWVIFVRANVDLGNKKLAMQAINTYLSRSFSQELQDLRRNIQ